jgi:hypothetical protein
MRYINAVILILAPIFSTSIYATESIFISCDGSPREAQLELPGSAKEWGKVACTQYGHIIMAQDGWSWGNSISQKPVFIPADLLNSSKIRAVGNTVYFKHFTYRQLSKKDALKRHELFYDTFGKDRTTIYPEVWELIAENESGKSLTLIIFRRHTQGGWGIACMPDCETASPFVIVKKDN